MSNANTPAETVKRPQRFDRSNLRLRIVSALILAALALAFNFASVLLFALLVVAVAALMAWEWGAVVRQTAAGDSIFAVHAVTMTLVVLLAIAGYAALAASTLCAGTLVVAFAAPAGESALSALGVPYIGLPALALVWLRSDEPYGAMAVFLLLLVVWAADTAAFLSGRLIGGPKLWPAVSPNKTWAGVAGGVIASGLTGALFSALVKGASPYWLALSGLIIGCVALLGDLGESALKRGLGVKDASNLIPGHGGFMDRLDSIVAVAVAAALLALLLDPKSPARALLFGS